MPSAKLHCLLALVRSACVSLSILAVFPLLRGALPPGETLGALYPSKDGWGDVLDDSNAHDGDPKLRAKNNAREIYIRFSIGKNHIDDHSTPLKAILTLTKESGGSATETVTIFAAKNWDSTPSWGSRPVVSSIRLNKAGVNSTGSNLVNPSFDVTDYISGPGEYTFTIRTSSGSDVVYKSTNSTSGGRPELVLTKPNPANVIPFDHDGDPETKPKEHTEYERLVSDVMRRGAGYRERYIAFNPSGANDVDLVGYFDVTKSPYNAAGDCTGANDGADDTVAIQRAINEARDARVAVYFPAGKKFRVTAPLECVQGSIKYENKEQIEYNPAAAEWEALAAGDFYKSTGWERWNHREFPCVLMGAPLPLGAGSRPQLIAGGTGTGGAFGNQNNPVPLLHFWSRGTGEGTGNPPAENYPAASYNHLVRNLDINLRGRPGAIGVNMVGTQGTAIESLKIVATNSYAGISGLPGAGGCTSAVTIQGGRFGIDAFKTTLDGGTGIASVLNNCTIDATSQPLQENSIRWNHYGPLVLVGCAIVGGAVQIEGPGNEVSSPPTGGEAGETSRGNLSIADSTLERLGSAANRPAIEGSRSVYLRNVYLKNVTRIADIDTASDGNEPGPAVPSPTPSPVWFRVKEYAEGAKLDQYSGKSTLWYNYAEVPVEGADYTRRYINGAVQSGPISHLPQSSFPVVSAPPSGFFEKHIWPQAIDWTGADVINVKNLQSIVPGYVGAKIQNYSGENARGDNMTDDLGVIQAAIDYAEQNNKKVFIPVAQYVLNDTLILKNGVTLFGLHRNYSVLKANDHPHMVDENGAWVGVGNTIFDTGGPASGTALVMTSADSAGDKATKLADLMLLQRMTAEKTYLLDWNAGDQSVVQNVNFNRQMVNGPKFSGSSVMPNMNIPLIKIGILGGGKWYGMFHLSGGNVGADYRGISIKGPSARALRFYMFNPEIDAGPTYNAEIAGRTNLDVFGSKAEGRHTPFVRIANCADVRWFGFAGNAYCDRFITQNGSETNATKAASQAVIEVEDCGSILLSSSSFYPNFLFNDGDFATDPMKFYRLKEKVGTNYNTTQGHLGFVFFRRDPNSEITDDN